MAENSGIEWTHHTFNPWIGCTKVSAACDNCYAERWDQRFTGGDRWGPRAQRTRTAKSNWSKPITWNHKAGQRGVRERVFCASLADVFDNHKSIHDDWRRDLWELIDRCRNLDWLLLTKRPQNIKRLISSCWLERGIPSNVWIGTTVENQDEANRRIPHLVRIPAAVRFLSCEPLLGPLDLSPWLFPVQACGDCPCPDPENDRDGFDECCRDPEILPAVLQWVITGGESGPGFRKSNPDWLRDLQCQCHVADVPFLFKQWEGRTTKEIKALGRELDGVVHDGYPKAPQS